MKENNKVKEVMSQITEMNRKLDEARKAASKAVQEVFHEGLKVFFEEYPFIKQIHFTGYTPYFNDGEECTYSCYHGDCGFNGYYDGEEDNNVTSAFGFEAGEDIETTGRKKIYVEVENPEFDPTRSAGWSNQKTKWEHVKNPDYNPLYGEAIESVRKYLDVFSDEQYKDMLGDHAMVMIDVEGVHVEEYTHE
jgi:hypothetical protein